MWTSEPFFAVSLSVNRPRAVEPNVRIVSVDEPGAGTGLRLKLVVAPAGSPVTDSETLPLKPPIEAMVTAYEPLLPRLSDSDDGLTAIEKSRLTVRLTWNVCEIAPLVPVIVRT